MYETENSQIEGIFTPFARFISTNELLNYASDYKIVEIWLYEFSIFIHLLDSGISHSNTKYLILFPWSHTYSYMTRKFLQLEYKSSSQKPDLMLSVTIK